MRRSPLVPTWEDLELAELVLERAAEPLPETGSDVERDVATWLVRRFLRLCEEPRTRDRMLALVRASQGSARAGRLLYAGLNRVLVSPVARVTGLDGRSVKWEMVAAHLVGLATIRYVVRLEPIASADLEEVVALAAPAVRAVLEA